MTSTIPEIPPPAPASPAAPMPPRGGLERWCGWIALTLAALSLLSIRSYPFYDPDEFNYIDASRGMVEQGDWITPHFNGEARVVKPVLFYWIVAATFKIFGAHVALARLCSAAAEAAGVVMVGLTARHLLGNRAALLAALFAAGHLSVAQLSHVASVDPTLWAFTAVANCAFIRVAFPLDDGALSRGCGYLFFAATALALLTKGPVALVWCLVPFLWLIIRRDWAALGRFPWVRGVLLMLLLVVPWASFFIARNAHQLKAMLWESTSHESYAQFAGPTSSLGDAARILEQLLPSIGPWLPLIILALVGGWRAGFNAKTRCGAFLIFWLATLLLILTLAHNKSFRYMLTPIGPTCLLLAGWFDAALDDPKTRRGLSVAAISYGIVTALLAVPILVVIFANPHEETRWLWGHVAVLAICSEMLLRSWRSGRIHRLLPAMVVGVIYVNMFVANLSIPPLTGTTMATLGGVIERSVPPDQPFVAAGGLSPRYLVYFSRRLMRDVRTPGQLAAALETAPACLVRQRDWDQVPPQMRAPFVTVAHCIVPRRPPILSPVLAKNREEAILVVRQSLAATQPSVSH